MLDDYQNKKQTNLHSVFLTTNLQYNTVSTTLIQKIKSLQMEELNLLIRLIGETILRA